jgi:hypothetical protein
MSETYQPVVQEKASGMAIASLVLGILGFCCCGIIAGIPALIIGYMENGKINRGESSPKGKGFCIAGMILGAIAIVLGCIQIIWIVFFGGMNVLQGMSQSHF